MGDMDDFNPMWWLNEGSSDASGPADAIGSPSNNLLDDLVGGDLRRCYSETSLLQFESADVQAALVRTLI